MSGWLLCGQPTNRSIPPSWHTENAARLSLYLPKQLQIFISGLQKSAEVLCLLNEFRNLFRNSSFSFFALHVVGTEFFRT